MLLSTGECPLVSHTADPGVRGRVVTLTGLAFDAVDAATATRVADLRRRLGQHHGHAGRVFRSAPARPPGGAGQVRRDYVATVERLQQKAKGGGLLGLAESVAVVSVASQLAHTVLGLAGKWTDPVDGVWEQIVEPAGGTSRRRRSRPPTRRSWPIRTGSSTR